MCVALLSGCAKQTVVSTAENVLPSAESEAADLLVWARTNEFQQWRILAPVEAAGTDPALAVTAVGFHFGQDLFDKRLAQAIESGQAPDIVLLPPDSIPYWAEQGAIVPFDDCRRRHPQFDQVLEQLWAAGTWQGRVWGVPQHVSVRVFFYNKMLLETLGWTEEQTAGLPEQIRRGDFTLDDMVKTAEEAIEAGIVASGFGYWSLPEKSMDFLQIYTAYGGRITTPDTGQLVISRGALSDWYTFQRRLITSGITSEGLISPNWSKSIARGVWADAVVNQHVLFWSSGLWHWSEWAGYYAADLGGERYLHDFIGYALPPSGQPGTAGQTLSTTAFYSLVSPEAVGSDNLDAACGLLARVTTPEINSNQAVLRKNLGILHDQEAYPAYRQDRLLSDTHSMLAHNWFLPNHPALDDYFDILWGFMLKAQSGEMAPEAAAEMAVQQLQDTLGETIRVEN
jgi:inositol-phosphate transport system substrate-binding protein